MRNFEFTKDFKIFKPITDIHPEKEYNWMTSELVDWQMTDGNWSQGILYKPQNFDSSKKYPLIFDYYEKRSGELHKYIEPEFSIDRINIPYYVSNGYLIFVPDIYYKQGHSGEGVVNSVVSAARFLSRLPYVDSTKLGLQGHSFGGWETNILITNSNIFKAACEASGVSDAVSSYGQIGYGEGAQYSRQAGEIYAQGSPYGLGITPWTAAQSYINRSPIFKIGQINTPLLIMHNDLDAAVPFAQGLEMYLGMRRAGKKSWLLEYPAETHGLFLRADAKDYTIRMKQFFDYYLKNAPPPKWMTEDSSDTSLLTNPYELDYSGKQP